MSGEWPDGLLREGACEAAGKRDYHGNEEPLASWYVFWNRSGPWNGRISAGNTLSTWAVESYFIDCVVIKVPISISHAERGWQMLSGIVVAERDTHPIFINS